MYGWDEIPVIYRAYITVTRTVQYEDSCSAQKVDAAKKQNLHDLHPSRKISKHLEASCIFSFAMKNWNLKENQQFVPL
jgi:hypothetical protein